MQAYTNTTAHDQFSDARKQFGSMLEYLQGELAGQLDHGTVEAYLDKEGNKLMQQLLQSHIHLRSLREERKDSVVGPDGERRRYCRARQRIVETLFGAIEVPRKGYSDVETSSIFPLDGALNLPADRYSHGLRRRVAKAVATGSFDEAVKTINETTGGSVPKRQVEQLAQRVSADFVEFYEEKPQQDEKPREDTLLVMTTDGKGVVMRKEDLRDATRRAAEKNSHKLKTRLSKGEKRNRKRMATVAALYNVQPYHRSIPEILGQTERLSPRPRPTDKRVWASVEREARDVIDELFREAASRDPEHKRQWLMLVDGHEGQLRDIQKVAKAHRADVVIIQDFVHVLEYLWKAAYCFHPEGSEEAERWVLQRAEAILQGDISETAAGMRRSATRRNLAEEKRLAVDKCADYLLKNKTRLDYRTALANGWPIGTGVVEGACRHVVKDRMEITGARWSLKGAEAVLRLRSLYASGDLDAYMNFHLAKERLRLYGEADDATAVARAA